MPSGNGYGSAPAQTGQGFQVNAGATAGIGTPGTGFAMTLLVVLGGLLLAYAATRRIQGA